MDYTEEQKQALRDYQRARERLSDAVWLNEIAEIGIDLLNLKREVVLKREACLNLNIDIV